MGYFKDTLKGLTYKSLSRISMRMVGFVKFAVIARILGPVEFGLFGLASLTLTFLETMTDTGINIFLIQENDEYKKYLNSVFVVSVIRGVIISCIIIASTPIVEVFFKVADLRNIMYLIAVIPFVRGFINPAIIKFEKDLRFDRELILRLFLVSCDAVVSIVYVSRFYKIDGLIVGMIAAVILEMAISWIFLTPKPHFVIYWSHLKYILKRGKWITLTGILSYLYHNIDDVLVGKMLGLYNLGLYQLSYRLATLPIYETGEIFGRVTFPVYSKIADDKVRLRKAFYKVTLTISLLVIPAGLILIFFTDYIVLLLLGEKWLSSVGVIRILAVFSVIRAISGSVTPLFYALKKQEIITLFMSVGLISLLVIIIPLINIYGLKGAAISTIISAITAIPVLLLALNKIF